MTEKQNSLLQEITNKPLPSWFMAMYRDDEKGIAFLTDQMGRIIFSKEEFLQAFEKLRNFYDQVDDQEIQKYNQEILHNLYSEEYKPREKKPRNKYKGWVYVVQGEDDLYKIGLSKRYPDERLADFSPKLPFEPKLIHVMQVDDIFQTESDLHQHFSDKRVRGEWFRLTGSDIEYIKELAQ